MFLVHGQSILQILTEATQAPEKENGAKRGKPQRAGSVAAPPPRSKTPSYAPSSSTSSNKNHAITPAVPNRPPSSMSRTRSASAARRPRLGEATSTFTNSHATSSHVAPLPVPIIPIASSRPRPPSPSGLRVPSASHVKTDIPQPTPQLRVTGVKRSTPMGAGRVGSAQRTRTHNYHPYPRTQRSVQAPTVRVYGALGLNSSVSAAPAATARKASASNQRRESFKPRPSIDDGWGGGGGGGDKRFAGFAGGVVAEEDGDF